MNEFTIVDKKTETTLKRSEKSKFINIFGGRNAFFRMNLHQSFNK